MRRLIGGYSITAIALFAAAFLATSPARAVDYTWALGDAGGEWTTDGNWDSSGYPDALDDTATFDTLVTANRTVTQASDVTLSKLHYSATGTGSKYLYIGDSTHTITFAGTDPTLQSDAANGGWASVRINSKIDVGTGGLTVTSSGAPRRGTRAVGGILGSGDVTVTGGTFELQGNSSTFSGKFIIQNAAEMQVVGNAATAMGDTAHATEIHGTGYLQFRGVAGTSSEPIDVYGIRTTGSIDQFATNGVTINGPVTLYSDTSFGIHSWISSSQTKGAKQDFTVNSVIADGNLDDHNVYFLGNLSGTSAQGTESRKSEFLLGAQSTYGGNTYLTTNMADDLTKGEFSGNMRLTVDNALPTGTTLVLGGVHSTASGNLGTTAGNAKFALGGHAQELAGLVTSGTGTRNMVVGASTTLSTLTLNIASGTNTYDGYLGYADDVDDGDSTTYEEFNRDNLKLVKTGAGTLELTAANTYDGGTDVFGGTLSISSDANLGTAPAAFDASLVRIDGATLHASSTFAFDYNRGLTVMSGGATFDVDTGQTLTILRNANGTDPSMVVQGDIVKEGDGMLIFGDTSWTIGRTLTVNGGTVQCYSTDSDDGSIRGDITVNSGGTYDHRTVNGIRNNVLLTANTGGAILLNAGDALGGFAGGGTISGSSTTVVDYTGATPVDFSGQISGNLNFDFRGNTNANGVQIFSGDNTYTGTTKIQKGTLQIGAGGSTGTLGTGAVTVNTPGTLRFYRSDSNLGVTSNISGTGNLVFLGPAVSGQGGYEINGDLSGFSGTVTIDDARVRVNADSDLGTAAVTVQDGGQLFAYGGTISNSLTIAGTGWQESAGTLGAIRFSAGAVVSGPVALAADSSVHAHGSGDTGTISGDISGGYALEKTGAGTVILSGTNSYTGTTTVSNGVLQVNSIAALPANADVAAAGTLRLLSGNTVWGNTVTGSGTVQVEFAAGSGNTQLTGITAFNGTVELTTTAPTGDKWRAQNVNAPGTSVLVNPGTQLFVVGTDTFEGVSASGTGNTENRGAIRVAGTLNAPITLLGDTTIAPEAGSVTGAITSGATGTQVLRIGGTATNPFGTTFTGVIGGGLGTIALEISNQNSGLTFIPGSSLNTYTGGTLLLNGTRLRVDGISGTPYGTGAITLGQAATDRAGIFFTTSNQTLTNDIVFNTALGTDRPGVRADGANVTLSGTITANLAPATFSTNGNGSVNLTGQVTGSHGLTLHNQYGSTITATLNNTTASPNDYQGDTVAGTKGTFNLGASNQIPNGPAAGNLINDGTFNMNGFSETINGLSGSGTVDGVSGTPTLTVGDNDANSTFSGSVANSGGSLSLVKTGAGTQVLSGNNTYAGTTTVSAGTLQIGEGGTSGTLGSGAVTNNAALVFNRSDSVSVSSAIDGSGSLTQDGTGTLTLSGVNTYTGDTNINSGTVKLQWGSVPDGALYHLDATAGVVESGGSVSAWNDQTANGNDFAQATAANQPQYVPGALNGLPVIRFDGAADPNTDALVLGSATSPQSVFIVNTPAAGNVGLAGLWGYYGSDAGIRAATATSWQNPGNTNDFTSPTGSTMYLDGVAQAGNATFATDVPQLLEAIRSSATTYNTTSLGLYYLPLNRRYKGDIAEVIVYGSALTETERTAIERYLTRKWLGAAAGNVLPATTALQLNAGATLDLNGLNQTIASLADGGAGGGTVVNGDATTPLTLTINPSAGSTTFSGSISDAGPAGALSLAKTGAGTQVLSGTSTYSGATSVSEGTLLVNGSHLGGAAYTVDGTGTLGGIGTIGSQVTIAADGTLAPGTSPGILTLEDGVTFTGGSFAVELNGPTAGTDYDQLLVTGGDVNLGLGVATLDITAAFSPGPNDLFWIINNTSTSSGLTEGFFEGLEDEGSSLSVAGRRFYVYYHADIDTNAFFGGNDVLLTSVPEPSTLAMLLGLAGLGLLGYLRRRR